MPRRNRKVRSRRPNSNTNSRLDRLRSGIPRTIRTRLTDPPGLPVSLAFSIRCRIMIYVNPGSGGIVVDTATTPSGFPTVTMGVGYSSTLNAQHIAMPMGSLIHACVVRLFGYPLPTNNIVDPDTATDQNIRNTEYALGKTTLYGPTSQVESVGLAIDYGVGIPGYRGNDVGDRNRRPVLSATPPRLDWRRYKGLGLNGPAEMVLSYYGINVGATAGTPSVSGHQPYGCVDYTMYARRSFYPQIVVPNTTLGVQNETWNEA